MLIKIEQVNQEAYKSIFNQLKQAYETNFRLETMEGSLLPQPTSKQILLSTIEYIINSHGKYKSLNIYLNINF